MNKILICLSYFRTARSILPLIKILSKDNSFDVNIFFYRQLGTVTRDYNYQYSDVDLLVDDIKKLDVNIFYNLEPYSESSDYITKSLKKFFLKDDFNYIFFDETNLKITWSSLLISYYFSSNKTIKIGFQEGSPDYQDETFISMSNGLGYMYDYLFLIGDIDVEEALKINKDLKGRCFAIGLPIYDDYKKSYDNKCKKNILLFITSFTKQSGKSSIFKPLEPKHILKSGLLQYANENKSKLLIKEKIKIKSKSLAFKSLESSNVIVSYNDDILFNNLSNIKICIGAPSTLQLLFFFLRIPTIIIKKPYSGRLSKFKNYKYLVDINKIKINKNYIKNFDINYQNNFAKKMIGNFNKESIDIFYYHFKK